MRTALRLCVFFAALLQPLAAAAGVDLALANVTVEYDGINLSIVGEVHLYAEGGVGPMTTSVRLYLDDVPMYSVPLATDFYLIETCEESYPDCDGLCQPMLINGQITPGTCNNWPQLANCCCLYLIFTPADPIPYAGQTTCTMIVDENDQIQEADETNNVYTVDLSPIDVPLSPWSAVKALYR